MLEIKIKVKTIVRINDPDNNFTSYKVEECIINSFEDGETKFEAFSNFRNYELELVSYSEPINSGYTHKVYYSNNDFAVVTKSKDGNATTEITTVYELV